MKVTGAETSVIFGEPNSALGAGLLIEIVETPDRRSEMDGIFMICWSLHGPVRRTDESQRIRTSACLHTKVSVNVATRTATLIHS